MKRTRLLGRFVVVVVAMGAILMQGGVSLAAPQADLKVTKTGPATVPAGTNITYTITVDNNGPDTATAPTLTDAIPPNTTFVSIAATGWSCSGGGTRTCTRNTDMANGDSDTISLVVHVTSAPATCTIKNTASVDSSTADPAPGNNSNSVTTTVSSCADVSVTKTDAPDPVAAGHNLTYMITVMNKGPNSASGVTLNDTLPAGTTFVSLTCPSGWTCSKPAIGGTGTVTATDPSVANGSSATFKLVVKVSLTPTKCTITNTAKVTASTIEPAPGNNSDTTNTNITACADLSVTKSASPSPVTAGTSLTYTITVKNKGPLAATSVSLTDALPTNTTFLSATCPSGWSCTAPAVGGLGTVTATISSLANGASATFTVVVKVAPSAPGGSGISNTATVSAGTASAPSPDPLTSNNKATATALVHRLADLSITERGRPHPVRAGHRIFYTITVSNEGPSDAKKAKVRDFVAHHVVFRRVSAPVGWFCSHPSRGDQGLVQCTNAGFESGDVDVLTIVVRVKAGANPGVVVSNTARVTSPTPDPFHGNNHDTVIAKVRHR